MFAATWDEFLWPLIVLQSPDKMPMSAEIWLLLDKFLGAGHDKRAGGRRAVEADAATDERRSLLERADGAGHPAVAADLHRLHRLPRVPAQRHSAFAGSSRMAIAADPGRRTDRR